MTSSQSPTATASEVTIAAAPCTQRAGRHPAGESGRPAWPGSAGGASATERLTSLIAVSAVRPARLQDRPHAAARLEELPGAAERRVPRHLPRNADNAGDPGRARGHDVHAVAHEHRFVDVVRHQQGRHARVGAEPADVYVELLAGQGIDGTERLV